MGRGYGNGTVFQRADGRWIARVELRRASGARRRRTFSAPDREGAESKLDAWLVEHGHQRRPSSATEPGSREGRMKRARKVESHTAREWDALRHGVTRCHYCRRETESDMLTCDHATPVSRGGSDGIDNLRVACWDCNYMKRDMTEPEFIEWADATGLFFQSRRWRKIDGRFMIHAGGRVRPQSRFIGRADGRVQCTACGKAVGVTRWEAARVHRDASGETCLNSGRFIHGRKGLADV